MPFPPRQDEQLLPEELAALLAPGALSHPLGHCVIGILFVDGPSTVRPANEPLYLPPGPIAQAIGALELASQAAHTNTAHAQREKYQPVALSQAECGVKPCKKAISFALTPLCL